MADMTVKRIDEMDGMYGGEFVAHPATGIGGPQRF
jgi:hypothetical protein